MMKYIIFIIILITSTFCLADNRVPSVENFMVGVNIKEAKKECLKQNGIWTKEKQDLEAGPGDFYKCNKYKGKIFHSINFYVFDNIILYFRFIANSKEFCDIIEENLKDIPSCVDKTMFWEHCEKSWKSNCYNVEIETLEGKKGISILDVVFSDDATIPIDSKGFI